MRVFRFIAFGVLSVGLALAQKQELQALQRDVALTQADVAKMRESIEAKLEALTAVAQQANQEAAKNAAAITALDQKFTAQVAQLTEQQKSAAAPVAELGAKLNTMTDELAFMRESAASQDAKLSKLNAQLVDVLNAIRALQPPPPPPADPAVAAPTAPSGPPPGLSADQLYSDAYADFQAGKFDIAMQEFEDYLKWFDKTDYAPNAHFYIGNIYFKQTKHEDALKQFDAVLEKFPEGANKKADALYMRGRTLAQMGDKAAAAEEYRSFLAKYKRHVLTPEVQAALKAVSAAPAPKKRR